MLRPEGEDALKTVGTKDGAGVLRRTAGEDALETENQPASPFSPGTQVGLKQVCSIQAGMLTFLPALLWRFLTVRLGIL